MNAVASVGIAMAYKLIDVAQARHSFTQPTSSAGLRRGLRGRVSLSCNRSEFWLIGRLRQLRLTMVLGAIPSVVHCGVVSLKILWTSRRQAFTSAWLAVPNSAAAKAD
jgi:hypothetical protein